MISWMQKFSKEMICGVKAANGIIRIDGDVKSRPSRSAVCVLYASRQSQNPPRLSCRWREKCAGWSPGARFPSSMDRLLTFWLAAGLTLPAHHWALPIPLLLETAHKFQGPSMKSASQHHMAMKTNSSTALTLISSLAKSLRNKWLGTLCIREEESWGLTASLQAVLEDLSCFISRRICCRQMWNKTLTGWTEWFQLFFFSEKCLHLAYSGIFKRYNSPNFCPHFNYLLVFL